MKYFFIELLQDAVKMCELSFNLLMIIITLHHLFFSHCVNPSVIVLNLNIFRQEPFLRERMETIISKFSQWPWKKMVCSYYCLILELLVCRYPLKIDEWIWQYANWHGYLTSYGNDNGNGLFGTRTTCKVRRSIGKIKSCTPNTHHAWGGGHSLM